MRFLMPSCRSSDPIATVSIDTRCRLCLPGLQNRTCDMWRPPFDSNTNNNYVDHISTSWNLIQDTPKQNNCSRLSITNIQCIVSLFITTYGIWICIVVFGCTSAAAETSSSKRRSMTQKARIIPFAPGFFTVDLKVYYLNDTK